MRSHLRFQPRTRSPLVPLLAVTILVAFLFAVDRISGGMLRAPMRSVVASVSSAAGNMFDGIGGSGVFSTKHSLAQENEALRTQLAAAQAALVEAGAARDENMQLREIVHLAEHAHGVAAPVASGSDASPYGTFLLGAGAAAGIAPKDIVFSADGYAIGRVSEVSGNTALVSEIFAPNASISVVIAGSALEATGQGGGNAIARAPRGLTVAEGDIVTAPVLGGIPVGVVGKVESDPASAYATIYFRTPANLTGLRFVYVRSL